MKLKFFKTIAEKRFSFANTRLFNANKDIGVKSHKLAGK